jgi:hypothetical protein
MAYPEDPGFDPDNDPYVEVRALCRGDGIVHRSTGTGCTIMM